MTTTLPAFGFLEAVESNICSGCGACAVAAGDRVRMTLSDLGTYAPTFATLPPETVEALDRVCPFSDGSENEDALAAKLFSGRSLAHDERFGHHGQILAGHVTDDDFRLRGSSGGLTSWVLRELLRREMVDGVIHMGGTDGGATLFSFTTSHTEAELLGRRKSQYYPGEISQVMAAIHGDGKRYAFVGVPCFVKAIRLLCSRDQGLAEQIAYTVGLVCGHLKSTRFAELMAWQVGVPPARLGSVDFRVKAEGPSAGHYQFAARARNEDMWHPKLSGLLYGGDWGQAFFQLGACDYCDDIFAETADIVFGDAWIPRFVKDWRGDNIVLCRSREIADLLADGVAQQAIRLDPVTEAEAEQSQAGNYRHRRDGLSVRLQDALRAGRKVPTKRVRPGSRRVGLLRRWLIRIRRMSGAGSHTAFAEARAADDLTVFIRRMRIYTRLMRYTHAVMRRLKRS